MSNGIAEEHHLLYLPYLNNRTFYYLSTCNITSRDNTKESKGFVFVLSFHSTVYLYNIIIYISTRNESNLQLLFRVCIIMYDLAIDFTGTQLNCLDKEWNSHIKNK